MKYLLIACFTFVFAACATTSDPQPSASLMDALMATHARAEREAAPQQRAFEEEVVVGMSAERVIQTVAAIGNRFSSDHTSTTHQGGGFAITSSNVRCFEGGEPASRDTETHAAQGMEEWEYTCLNRVYTLTFSEGVLTDIAISRLVDKQKRGRQE